MNDTFQFNVDLTDCEVSKSGSKAQRIIKGRASTASVDADGERILQDGLDLSYFLNRGWINYEHVRSDIIGVPIAAQVTKGGLDLQASLLEGVPRAEHVWTLASALAKSGHPRRLGFSVEGKVVERDGTTIKKARVYNVAVTPHPVNPEATFEAIVKAILPCECHGDACCKPDALKALEAGYGASPEAQTGGGAVRNESLDPNLRVTTFELASCRHLKGKAKELCERIAAEKSIAFDDAITFVQLVSGLQRGDAEAVLRTTLGSP